MSSPSTHLRAPLLWLLFPLMAGLAAAGHWPPSARFGLLALAGLAGAAGIAATWFALRPGRAAHLGWALCVCLAAGLGGFVLLHARQPHLHEWGEAPAREVTVTVRVRQVFAGTAAARSFSGVGEISATGALDAALHGRRVYFSAIRKFSVPPQRSGSYVMRGVVEPLPRESAEAGFNDYLENIGVRQRLTRAVILREEARPGWFPRFCSVAGDRLEKFLRHGLDGHPAVSSLYLAMLLGEKAMLSGEQQNAFMRSGTFHIFSISGLHVGVIALALHCALRLLRVPQRPAVAASLLVLWLYVQITGASPPATRAFLMIAFVLASRVLRLPGNALAALSAAALATLLHDPLQLFSTGFQMSYSVVTALVLMGVPLAESWLARWHPFALRPRVDWGRYHTFVNWSGRQLLGACAACWAAFLASTPSGIGYFHLFSPGSLPANLIILPLSTLAIISGFLSLLTGLAGALPLCALFNSAAAIIILIMDWLVQRGAGLPGISFSARFRHEWMAPASLVAMTAIMLVCVAGRWSRRYGGYWPPVALLVLIVLIGVKFG